MNAPMSKGSSKDALSGVHHKDGLKDVVQAGLLEAGSVNNPTFGLVVGIRSRVHDDGMREELARLDLKM